MKLSLPLNPMSSLNTSNSVALQVLMSETIFDIDFPVPSPDTPLQTPSIPKESEIILKTYGGNNKNILFVISDNNNDFLSVDAEIAFMKILRALKLTLDDIVLFNYNANYANLTFDRIKEKLMPRDCIFLGVDPKILEVEGCAENILRVEANVQFLYSYSFDEMLRDTEKKRLFWDAIKLMEL
jgi:hypothetical protein